MTPGEKRRRYGKVTRTAGRECPYSHSTGRPPPFPPANSPRTFISQATSLQCELLLRAILFILVPYPCMLILHYYIPGVTYPCEPCWRRGGTGRGGGYPLIVISCPCDAARSLQRYSMLRAHLPRRCKMTNPDGGRGRESRTSKGQDQSLARVGRGRDGGWLSWGGLAEQGSRAP